LLPVNMFCLVDPCYQNKSNCDLSKATCTYTGNLTYKCNCLNGYYGSGQQCGLDRECVTVFQNYRANLNVFIAALLSRLPGNCSANQFDCGNGACISAAKLHDCIVDCSDGSDESEAKLQHSRRHNFSRRN